MTITEQMTPWDETSFGGHSMPNGSRAWGPLPPAVLAPRIGHILFTEWDPCGVSELEGFDCRDEYDRYLPRIVKMVQQGASVQALSDQLMDFEEMILGDLRVRRRCDVIAVMVAQYRPVETYAPFVPKVSTDSPQSAYQSVLDLVTQTRLDTYQKLWPSVADGYSQAVSICSNFLPEKTVLLGSCLNNFGIALQRTGQLVRATASFETALAPLKQGLDWNDYSQYRKYIWCLQNLINNLEHQKLYSEAANWVSVLWKLYIEIDGSESQSAMDTQKLLERVRRSKTRNVELSAVRLPIESDGPSPTPRVIVVD